MKYDPRSSTYNILLFMLINIFHDGKNEAHD